MGGLRQVIVYEREMNKKTGYRTGNLIELGEATFHQFSVSFEEFENGPGQYPVAIIEHGSGRVEIVDADLIKFIS